MFTKSILQVQCFTIVRNKEKQSSLKHKGETFYKDFTYSQQVIKNKFKIFHPAFNGEITSKVRTLAGLKQRYNDYESKAIFKSNNWEMRTP